MDVIEFCNKNNILWQPLVLKAKAPCKMAGYTPKNNDYVNFDDEIIKARQKNITMPGVNAVGIYAFDIQQIDVDIDLGLYEHLNAPYFKSKNKKLPHFFVKVINAPQAMITNLIGGELLHTWGYSDVNNKVENSHLPIPSIEYKDIIEINDKIKKIDKVSKKVISESKIKKLDYTTWFNLINAVYNYSHDIGIIGNRKIIHHMCQQLDDYDSKAIKTINSLVYKKYPYNIEYINKLYKEEKKEEKVIEKQEMPKKKY